MTAGYFLSELCRKEYQSFRRRDERGPSRGTILPIYYTETEYLSDPALRQANSWAAEIAASQWVDWRDLHHEPWGAGPNRRIERMARAFEARLRELGVLHPPASKMPGWARGSDDDIVAPLAPREPDSPSVATEFGVKRPLSREIVVAADGRGDFRTISEALETANADDVVLVRPGTYSEYVVLSKSITLLGDGPRAEVLIEAPPSKVAVICVAPFGRMANLTVRSVATDGHPVHAVWVGEGRLYIEDCDIEGSSWACLGICGSAAPIVRRNRVHNSRQAGIAVCGNAGGTIEDNEIFDNGFAGVEIWGDAAPTVRRNRVRNNKGQGVYIRERGHAMIENNDISANGLAGVALYEEASAHVASNRVATNRQHGIVVGRGGRGFFERNELRSNRGRAWIIDPNSLPNVILSDNVEG